jgi:hypothetical protein
MPHYCAAEVDASADGGPATKASRAVVTRQSPHKPEHAGRFLEQGEALVISTWGQ